MTTIGNLFAAALIYIFTLPTKADFQSFETRIESVRTELKTDIESVRTELKADIKDLQDDVDGLTQNHINHLAQHADVKP